MAALGACRQLQTALTGRLPGLHPSSMRLLATQAFSSTSQGQKVAQSAAREALNWPAQGPGLRSLSTDSSTLPDTISLLRNLENGAEIFLVGTAHISSSSAEEVRDVIRRVRPNTVMVELDARRAQQLMSGDERQGFSFIQSLASKLGGGGGGSWAQMFTGAGISAMYRMLRYAGLDPGAEFKAAMLEAQAIGAKVVYGDQDANRTMERLSQHLGFQNLMRLFAASATDLGGLAELIKHDELSKLSLTDQVEAMKTRKNVRKMTEAMRRLNPGLISALVDERDQIMVDCLSNMQGKVVGVVGLGHLDGMERLWAERAAAKSPQAASA